MAHTVVAGIQVTLKKYFSRMNTSPTIRSTQFWPPDLHSRGSSINM